MKIGPWGILAALFVARLGMGFQFQLIASTAPVLQPAFTLSYADIGTLIGVYMLPGAVLALPASWLGARFGEPRLVIFGLILMVLGAALGAVAPGYAVLLGSHLIAGFGAILMNVLMSKLVLDWFAGGNVVLAMAIFVNSWPVGVGLALLVQAPLALSWGWPAAFWSGALVGVIGLLAFVLTYRPPAGGAAELHRQWPERHQWFGIALSSGVWAAFNVSFALIFSFGIGLLIRSGSDAVSANALISLIQWISAVCIPFAAAALQRLDGARFSVPAMLLAYAAAILYFVISGGSLPSLLVIAVVGSMPAGASVALVSRFLTPATRTLGMGLFYAAYYISMAVAPPLAGASIDLTKNQGAPLFLAAGFAVFAALLYAGALLHRPLPAPQPAS